MSDWDRWRYEDGATGLDPVDGPWDAGPDVDQIEAMVKTGALCGECLTEFTGPHGRRVVCGTCARETMIAALAEQGYQLATKQEKNRVAHANAARQRKARKA